jgi:hypothetical protein
VAGYNPHAFDDTVELRFLTAPVFGPDGEVAFTLTLLGTRGPGASRAGAGARRRAPDGDGRRHRAVGGTVPAVAASAMNTA